MRCMRTIRVWNIWSEKIEHLHVRWCTEEGEVMNGARRTSDDEMVRDFTARSAV
jgi:hypothetical protein